MLSLGPFEADSLCPFEADREYTISINIVNVRISWQCMYTFVTHQGILGIKATTP